MTLSDWEAQHQRRLTDRAAELRALLTELAEQNVTSIEADYDGVGDSGEVDRIVFSGSAGPVTASEHANLAVEYYVKTLLSLHHPGWETNEGSCGTVRINVTTRSVRLAHTTRYTDYVESMIEQAL